MILLHYDVRSSAAKATEKVNFNLGYELLPVTTSSREWVLSHYHLFRSMLPYLGTQQITEIEGVWKWIDDCFGSTARNFYEDIGDKM